MTAQLPNTGPHQPPHTGPHTPYRPQHNPPYTGQHAAPQPYRSPYGPQQAAPYTPYPAGLTVTATPHVIRGDRNGMGTAGLVMGIVSLAFAVIPIVGLIAWVLWPLGAIFGGVGLSRANRALATNRNTALAGLIVSMAAAAVCIAWVVFAAYASATGAAHH